MTTPSTSTKAANAVWAGNTTVQEAAQQLRAAQEVVLLTHSKPDGDAIGSCLAMARALETLGTKATIAFMGPWEHRFDGVVGNTPHVRIGNEPADHAVLGNPDTVLVLDTCSWSQLAEVKEWIASRTDKVLAIDHHRHGNPEVAAKRLVVPEAASTTQILADVCVVLLGVESPAQLPVEIAEPLYLGLSTDTGWYRHSNTTESVHRLAADLFAVGVDHPALYRTSEQSDDASRLVLIGSALSSMRTVNGGKHAIMQLTVQDFEAAGGELGQAGGFTDLPMTIAAVEASALLTEVSPTLTKVSFRSKTLETGAVLDVNLVAQQLGGGGHKQAAGAKIKAPIDEAVRMVEQALAGGAP